MNNMLKFVNRGLTRHASEGVGVNVIRFTQRRTLGTLLFALILLTIFESNVGAVKPLH